MEILASRLKQLRLEKELTLEQVAKALSTTKVSISRYENSAREPKSDTLIQLANYFDVSIDYLLGKTDERKSIANYEQDVHLILRKVINQLKNNEGLILDGRPLTKQSLETILLSIEIGIAMAQKEMDI
jgi:transcriptional regulator with XRE-family HTH domain